MIWLLLIPYLVVAFLVWGFASAMSHFESWPGSLTLGLLWPIYGLSLLRFLAAQPLRERFFRGLVNERIRELEEDVAHLVRQADGVMRLVERYQQDYEPKAETVQRWRREGEANGTIHHEFVPKEIGNQVACAKCGVGPGAFVHTLWSSTL